MPQNAIDAGVADAVLPADAMAEAIAALAGQVIAATRSEPAASPEFDAGLQGHPGHPARPGRSRLSLLQAQHPRAADPPEDDAGQDRDVWTTMPGISREHPDEVGLLQKDLLIGVTEFFRQPQAWEILEKKVIAPLVEKRPSRGRRSGSGFPAAPRARRSTAWPCCWPSRRRRAAGRRTFRSSPPTPISPRWQRPAPAAIRRKRSERTSRPSGSSGSSPARTAATRSSRASASGSSSPRRTSRPTRPSPGWT